MAQHRVKGTGTLSFIKQSSNEHLIAGRKANELSCNCRVVAVSLIYIGLCMIATKLPLSTQDLRLLIAISYQNEDVGQVSSTCGYSFGRSARPIGRLL